MIFIYVIFRWEFPQIKSYHRLIKLVLKRTSVDILSGLGASFQRIFIWCTCSAMSDNGLINFIMFMEQKKMGVLQIFAEFQNYKRVVLRYYSLSPNFTYIHVRQNDKIERFKRLVVPTSEAILLT